MREDDILNVFKECNALQEGHFLLSSGLHSPMYLQAALVLQYPEKAKVLCKELAKKFKDKEIDVVIGPPLGGIVLSYELAEILKSRAIFAERVNDKMILRRNFKIEPQEKVLIIEDVITTGRSVKELVDLVKESKARLVGTAALVDRSLRQVKFEDLKLISLLKLNIKTYNPENCPLCEKGLPLTKPGSRKR